MIQYTRIIINSGPDSQGRYHHARCWADNYFPGHPDGENVERERGQHFFSKLPECDCPIEDRRERP